MTGKRKPSSQKPTQDEAAPWGGPPEMPEELRPNDPEPLEEGHAHQSAVDAGRSATEEEAEERQKTLREDAEKSQALSEEESEAQVKLAERLAAARAKAAEKTLRQAIDDAGSDQERLAEQEHRELEGKVRADAARAEEVKRATLGDKPHPGQRELEEKGEEERADWRDKLGAHYAVAAQERAKREQAYLEVHQAAKAERERDPEQTPEGDEAEGQLGVATAEDEPVAKREGPGPDPGPPEGREDEPTMWDVRPGREPGREVPVGGAAPGIPSGHARPWQDRHGEPGHFKATEITAAKGKPHEVDKFHERKPKPHEIATAMLKAGVEHCRKGGVGDDYLLIRNSLTMANRMLGRHWHRITGRHDERRKREDAAQAAGAGPTAKAAER
jgi:hypothetical protein